MVPYPPPHTPVGLRIYSWLSRCGMARRAISGLSHGGPTKIKAHKYFLFTESSLKFVFVEAVTRMVTGCLKAVKV